MASFGISRNGLAPLVVALAAVAMIMALSAPVTEARAVKSVYTKLGPYYQHDIVSRPNFTDLIVTRGYTKTEGFGALAAFDDPLTVKPDITSKEVARVQGFQAVVSLDGLNVEITQTLVLPGGTMTFIGQLVSVENKVSRFHLIGGTGDYEDVVHGFYDLEVYEFNAITLDAILLATIYYRK